jgi:hypothetical protein
MLSGRRWRALMTASPRRIIAEIRLRRHAITVRRSGLFDAAWYLGTYPDVAATGLDPVRHYLRIGATEGRDPGPRFSSRDYLEQNPDVARAGINPLLHYIRRGVREGRRSDQFQSSPDTSISGELSPLRSFRTIRSGTRRVTLLTDSLGPESLFGGVATALLFATLLAQRTGAQLRVVTEVRPPDLSAVGALLRAHSVTPPDDISVVFAERRRSDRREIDLHDHDLFVSTAWWNTWNLLHAVAPAQIIHMLQEDERLFYPHGDQHLLCTEVLRTPGLRFAVNTRLLHEHFAAEGFDNIVRNGAWFEPAFPFACYRWEERVAGERRNFFFYARPRHPRNLYQRGLDVVRAAIERRILDPEQWNICFLGHGLSDVTLPRGVRPNLLQNLPWPDYAALMRQTDLGLGLMYTPHPSYPPLDLAASGAVAVTNRYGHKRSLAQYSGNILCVGGALESLLEGIEQGVRLAADLPARRRNYLQSGLARDWSATFQPAFDRLLMA